MLLLSIQLSVCDDWIRFIAVQWWEPAPWAQACKPSLSPDSWFLLKAALASILVALSAGWQGWVIFQAPPKRLMRDRNQMPRGADFALIFTLIFPCISSPLMALPTLSAVPKVNLC